MNKQWSHSVSQMIWLYASNTEEVCGYAYLQAVKYKQQINAQLLSVSYMYIYYFTYSNVTKEDNYISLFKP